MGKKKIDTRDIGLQIASIFGNYLLHTEHLHYGYWPEDLKVNLNNLRAAQNNYANYILGNIPKDSVKTILDVGCGTGHNAEILIANGYQVDCVSPSEYLSRQTRKKLPSSSEIFECFFEDMTTDKKYDLILFSESFQYIKMESALENCLRFLNPGGHIMIADFFRIPGEGESPMGGGHRLSAFQETVKKYPLQLLKEEDITKYTAPNLQLVDEGLQRVAVPLNDLVQDLLRINYGFVYKPVVFLAQIFFKKKLQKIHFKYLSGARNSENFKKFKSYRLFLFQAN